MTKWHSIKTAPRDGDTWIIAAGPEAGPVLVHWGYAEPTIIFGEEKCWVGEQTGPDNWTDNYPENELTIWTPLPIPSEDERRLCD